LTSTTLVHTSRTSYLFGRCTVGPHPSDSVQCAPLPTQWPGRWSPPHGPERGDRWDRARLGPTDLRADDTTNVSSLVQSNRWR